MKKEKGFTLIELLVVLAICIVCIVLIFVVVGYVKNIVKLCHCDFDSPFKAEVIRAVGIVIPPVGVVAGYCKINDKKTKKEINIYYLDPNDINSIKGKKL